MTLNYIADQTELLNPWQEITINISKEKAYELALLEKPKPEIIAKSTITYKPVINKAGSKTSSSTKKPSTAGTKNTAAPAASSSSSKQWIISKWTYTKDITNGFARGQCTWYAAIISPNIFTYTDDNSQ